MSIIEDGAGTSKKAKVDSNNRLLVQGSTEPDYARVSREEAETYIISHNDYIGISTVDTETGILYFENTDQKRDLYIHSIRTCGTGIQKWKLYKNVTGGTMVTEQVAAGIVNMNLTSGNTAKASVYKGAEGKTVSGGTMIGHHINGTGYSLDVYDGGLILTAGQNLALTCEVPVAIDVCTRFVCWYVSV